jgi:hypothetical protein
MLILYILLHTKDSNDINIKPNTPLLPSYGKTKLQFLISSELHNFFKSTQLRVPSCLRRSTTIWNKRIVKSIAFLCRYLMYSGLLLKCISSVNKALAYSFLKSKKQSINNFYKDETYLLDKKRTNTIKYGLNSRRHWQIFSYLNYKLYLLKPLFYFYIYKVDKQIYKNSRGKSGKYTFLWKYVQPAKRMNLIVNQLAKDIRFNSHKNFHKKIHNSILRHLSSIKLTFTYKSIRFSNNYVFLNAKSTLLKNYRTVKSS